MSKMIRIYTNYVHLKTKEIYFVMGLAIDATNTHNSDVVVIYAKEGKLFVREVDEFLVKFKSLLPREDTREVDIEKFKESYDKFKDPNHKDTPSKQTSV